MSASQGRIKPLEFQRHACAECAEKDAKLAQLMEQLERYKHAVQRDSWAYESRSTHDAKGHVKLDDDVLRRGRK